MSEREETAVLANFILDVPNKDPDDNESTLARQFLRALEREDQLKARVAELENQEPTRKRLIAQRDSAELRMYAESKAAAFLGETSNKWMAAYDNAIAERDAFAAKLQTAVEAIQQHRDHYKHVVAHPGSADAVLWDALARIGGGK
jgi:hypothetical protein